ncbi:hypothetical protein PHYSODRAFT_306229 [Phytophthora sojae]|uniref:Uncharacterized protein n=1 Tax=Phytophthora sojae (strain P6497) TaxID=1094619 RepID=G5A8I0_PHYSP|nr:hypothetical protein PHYSODRAFT_306229 [Phytophthora sojae]EGZ08206.1 hypothetical protein PHYSODRAFT_306229 [Phytophthora sojae]|eukprot:XP_009536378.1 hypothetical protein PHYSODRAFT_306229 [Phytophthora sojae]
MARLGTLGLNMGPTLAVLLDRNIWLSLLDLCLDDYSIPYEESYGQLLSSVFSSTRRPPDTAYTNHRFGVGLTDIYDTSPLQLGEIDKLCGSDLLLRDVGALCSTVVQTQMTRQLSLDLSTERGDHGNNSKWWVWLAYALFSNRARALSSVESVDLIISSMTVSDMSAFTFILASDHPEEDLFDSTPGPAKARDATLKGGSRIRCVLGDLSDSTNVRTITVDDPVPFIRTFSDDGKSTRVDAIVPGYGRCLVRRRDLVCDDEISSRDNTVDSGGGVTSLRLRFDKNPLLVTDGLTLFFGAIGSSLKRLMLDAPRDDLSSIIKCCASLEELSLSGGVVDARLNFCCFYANGEPLPELGFHFGYCGGSCR